MRLKLEDLDTYEFLCREWLSAVASILNERVMASGLSEEKSKEVCGQVLFEIAMLHDQHGLDGEWAHGLSESILPRLGFVDVDGDLISGREDTYHHEYVFKVVEAIFEK